MNVTSKATRRIVAMTMALLGCLGIVGSPRAEHTPETMLGLTKPSDFTPLAEQGFGEHAAGTIDPATGDPILVPDPLGSRMNGDTWSMQGWDPPGALPWALFVGTNRNAGCFTDPDAPEHIGTCPVPGPLGIPALDQDDRGEIWRWTTDGFNNGRTGTWTRVYQSPMSFVLTLLMPRHIGYRSMIPCNAGGPERLYVSANGPNGEIISTNGSSVYPGGPLFQRASTVGLNTLAVSGINADIGYGRIQCHTGPDNVTRLFMSPVGSLTNNDAPLPGRAVVLTNNNPSNTSSPWLTVSQSGFGNANNNSLFNLKVFKNALNGFNYLYFGVMNNTTGAEIWRTAGCTVPPPGCGATYEKVLEFGGGRNELHPDPEPGEFSLIANQVVAIDMETLDVNGDGHDDYLYVAIGHIASGGNDFVRAELIRFNANDPLPDRGKKWELVVGKSRLPSDFPILNFNCNNHIPDGVGGSLPADPDICFPLSGRGEGFGNKLGAIGATTGLCADDFPPAGLPAGAECYNFDSPTETYAYFKGPNAYFWNAEQCDTNGDNVKELYYGTLDRGGGNFSQAPRAADLWRTVDGSNGEKWQLVDTTGFGNRNNGGHRGMACTPFGLAVGTSNRRTNVTTPGSTGGTEIHLGTCAPDGPLVADARVVTKSSQPNQVDFDGLKYIAYDDENYPAAGDGFVTNVKLDGSNSANRFCGHPIATYEWHTGDLVGSCADLDPGDVGSFLASTDVHTIASLATSITPYTFTLKVTSTNAANAAVIACDKVDVLASANQRPKAAITTPALGSTVDGGLVTGNEVTRRLTTVDLDGDGFGSVNIVGNCTDPENDPDGTLGLLSCEWSNPLPGVTFTTTACAPSNSSNCETTATVEDFFRNLDIRLTATDLNGNKHFVTLRFAVRATSHDLAVTAVTLPLPPADENVAETVDVTVENEGDFPETNFTVTLGDSAGGTILPPSYTVASLDPGASTTLSFTWTPTSGGNITLTATAATVPSETNTGNNTKSIQVAVTNVNEQPDAVNDTATTPEGTPVDKNVLANDTDPDGDPLTVELPLPSTTTTQGGTVSCTGAGLCTYTPPAAFTGMDTFTYTACDTGVPVLCDPVPATVTVTVTVIPPTLPTPPTGVTVTDTGPLTVQVTWTDGSFETRYEVRRCRLFLFSCIGTTILTTTLPANTTVFNSTVPQAGTWRYLVRGCNSVGACSTQAQGQAAVN